MTPKGAKIIIESLSMRIFDIQDAKEKLSKEEEALRIRIRDLEQIQDPIVPTPIITINK